MPRNPRSWGWPRNLEYQFQWFVMVDLYGKAWPLAFQMYKSKMDNVEIMFLLKNAAVHICNVQLNSWSYSISPVPVTRPGHLFLPYLPDEEYDSCKLLILQLCPSTCFALCGKNVLLSAPLELTQTYTGTSLPTGYCELTGSAAPSRGGVQHVKVKERAWVAVYTRWGPYLTPDQDCPTCWPSGFVMRQSVHGAIYV